MSNTDPTGAAVAPTSFDAEADLQAALAADLVPMSQEPSSADDESTGDQLERIPVIPLPKRRVSGRYRSAASGYQLELRIDVDGVRSQRRVSGDFYAISGATRSYFGSFVVDAPAIIIGATLVTVTGLGRYTWSAGAPRIRLTVPRVSLLSPPAAATLQFQTLSGSPGATYVCPFESAYFRTLQIETDRVNDVVTPVFASYNTGSLPSGGAARPLSVVGAFAEAGIQLQVSTGSNVLDITTGAGGNARWSDAELHASMVHHFSLWQDVPQYKVWQLVAQNYDNPSVLGIMFDQQGRHRQGCAVFHGGLGGVTADRLRLQLFAYVHELGHCFNLLHSWQKSFATPPGVNRPTSLSWMNYPQLYPGGTSAFWNAFPFQFDDGELVHLRHAFFNHIAMGGSNFTVGSGLEDVEKFNAPLEDLSGLKLELSAARSFATGEPVVVNLKLEATDTRGKSVHPYLNPAAGLLHIAIRKPGGAIVLYEPMIEQCVAPKEVTIDPANPIEESVYIGYGHEGQYFEQPGSYELRAVYNALDGSQVVSNTVNLRVRAPITATDDAVADLVLNDDVGALFYLQGSDAEELRGARDALDLVIDKHPQHTLAAYARLTKGANLAREFKTVRNDSNRIQVRKANVEESRKLLAGIVETPADATAPDRSALTMAMIGIAEPDRKVATRQRAARRAAGAREGKALARSYE